MGAYSTIAKPQHGASDAGQHARTAASVRKVREKLASGGDQTPEFEYELLLILVKNELSAILTIPLLAIIIALAAMVWAPPGEALLWLFVWMLARWVQLSFCQSFINTPRDEIDVVQWRKTLTAVEGLYGVTWSGIVLVGLNPSDTSAHIFVFASLIVVLTLRLILASTVMTIVYAGTVPMTLALAMRFMLLDDPFYWALASLAAGIHIYFIFLAKGLNSTVTSMLAYRAEKDALIAELEEAKSKSDEARRQAEEANIAKSQFLANMSHELRTPLNAILGFSEVMKSELMGPLNNKVYHDYTENIHSSGRHLLHVINEILDLSRIEAGRQDLNETAVHLIDIADDCQALLKLRADAKRLKIITNYDQATPALWADEKALRQICLNLLSNALKFTPIAGTITISVYALPEGDQVLSIADSGPGIPESELPKVMQAFCQGSLAMKNAEGGTGLGLPIVKSLVELHGGVFELTSELRKGTTAITIFPSTRAMRTVAALAEETGAERPRRRRPFAFARKQRNAA